MIEASDNSMILLSYSYIGEFSIRLILVKMSVIQVFFTTIERGIESDRKNLTPNHGFIFTIFYSTFDAFTSIISNNIGGPNTEALI